MGNFKETYRTYKNITPVLTGFVMLGIFINIIIGIYWVISVPSGDEGLGPAVLAVLIWILIILCTLLNVVSSLVVLNTKSFRDSRENIRLARKIFYTNILIVPLAFLLFFLLISWGEYRKDKQLDLWFKTLRGETTVQKF